MPAFPVSFEWCKICLKVHSEKAVCSQPIINSELISAACCQLSVIAVLSGVNAASNILQTREQNSPSSSSSSMILAHWKNRFILHPNWTNCFQIHAHLSPCNHCLIASHRVWNRVHKNAYFRHVQSGPPSTTTTTVRGFVQFEHSPRTLRMLWGAALNTSGRPQCKRTQQLTPASISSPKTVPCFPCCGSLSSFFWFSANYSQLFVQLVNGSQLESEHIMLEEIVKIMISFRCLIELVSNILKRISWCIRCYKFDHSTY